MMLNNKKSPTGPGQAVLAMEGIQVSNNLMESTEYFPSPPGTNNAKKRCTTAKQQPFQLQNVSIMPQLNESNETKLIKKLQ